jgi:Tfp pilus assembly protein PilO
MPQVKKYSLLILLTIASFIYVVSTEVKERWAGFSNMYRQLREKEEMVLSPEMLEAKELNLMEKKRSLAALLTKYNAAYEQSQTGVFEFLSTTAGRTGIRLESLVPTASEGTGQIQDIGFKIQLSGKYHHIGMFVNDLENGTMKVVIKTLEISHHSRASAFLTASLEGVASIYMKQLLQ